MKVKTKYIKPTRGYFEIDNGDSVYRLMEKMTASMNQDKLAEFYERAKEKGNPLPMNSIQYIELFNDAMNSGNSDLLNFIQKGLQKWPNTLTRVIYNPEGQEDKVIHNYGTSDAYSIRGDIVGNNNWINEIDNLNALESLLKTKDINMLNKISNAIHKTPMYLWRSSSKPSEKQEHVVLFGAGCGRFDFDAFGSLSSQYLAFLVERIK